MFSRLFLSLLVYIMLTTSTVVAQKLLPVDEADQNKAFLAFRSKLISAIEQKDRSFISYALHPDARFNDHENKNWFLNSILNSGERMQQNRDKLLETLSMGGRFTAPDTFVAPWVTASWPEEIDPYTHLATIEDSVPMRHASGNRSPVVRILSFEIVNAAGLEQWNYYSGNSMHIQAQDGASGWIDGRKARSPLDQRIYFVRHNREWKVKLITEGCFPPAPAYRFPPIDEGPTDSSFLAFRDRLQQAVAEKDSSFIFSILTPDISSSFGGEDGIPFFKAFWGFSGSSSSGVNRKDFWTEMEDVLSMGGAFKDSVTFDAPYLFSSWPRLPVVGVKFDPAYFMVAIGEHVPVYAEPDSSSPRVAELNYDFLMRTRDYYRYGDWYKVYTMGGQRGFVRPDQVRNSIDYHAGFIKKNGRWLMRWFIAGD